MGVTVRLWWPASHNGAMAEHHGGITRLGRIRLLALSIAGAVCGHTFAYALSFPDRMSRQSVLRVTGHAYWHAALAAAAVAAAWFAVAHASRHFHAGRSRTRLAPSGPTTFAVLAGLQIGVFVGMEIIERLAAGAPVATVLDHHILVIGLAVQLLVAGALTVATLALGRAAEAIGRAWVERADVATSRLTWFAPEQRWPVSLAVVPCGSRGPPTS